MASSSTPRRPWYDRFASYFSPGVEPPNQSITSAGINVDLNSSDQIKQVVKNRQDWQNQVINTVYAVGELLYGIDTLASLISRVTFFAAKSSDNADDEPVRLSRDSKVAAEKMSIATIDQLGNPVTRTDKQYDIAFNLFSTGELYLCKIAARPLDGIPDDRWETRSVREISTVSITSNGKRIETLRIKDQITGKPLDLDPAKGDTFLRIFRADPYDHEKAISHSRAILGPAEELLWWDAAAAAAAKSRIRNAGAVGVPQNLEARPRETDPEGMTGPELFIYQWMEQMMKAINDPSDASAAVPYMFSYPPNDSGTSGIEFIKMEYPQDELMDQRSQSALGRIEGGFPLPNGIISGMEGTGQGTGNVITESVFRDKVEPGVVMIASALTTSLLYPSLRKAGITNPQDYFVWYDASALISHQDKAQNAVRALELGAINWNAFRRALGYRETDQATDAEREKIAEFIRSVRGSGQKEGVVENPSDPNEIARSTDPEAPSGPHEPSKHASEDDKTATTRGKGRKPVAASADEVLVAQLQVLCDEHIRRALERAGNRLLSRAKKNKSDAAAVQGVKNTLVASVLGPESCKKLDVHDVFEDAFDGLGERLRSFTGYDMVPDHAIDTLKDRLTVIAHKNLYSPVNVNGELLVSTDIIRQALSY